MELPLYQHALPVSKAFFFFFAWFRKINVYERNTIHHRLKAEVIQEMIAGKIGFCSMYTHTLTHTHRGSVCVCVCVCVCVKGGYRNMGGIESLNR